MVDVVAAQDLVTVLSDGATKTALQNKLNAIDNILVDDEHQLDLALKTSATTITLAKPFATTGDFYGINKAGVTIDGANNTITGGLKVVANNVVIKNVIVNNSKEFGVQFFNVTGGVLDKVTLSNSIKGGLQVNSSEVTVTNVKSIENGWGGVGVAKTTSPDALPSPKEPKLTVISLTHTSTAGKTDIWIDGKTTNDGWVIAQGYTESITGSQLYFSK